MITFGINHGDTIKEISINPEEKIVNLKKNIIELLKLDVKYIDLIINLERPIRCLGKFNLESGQLPRTFDNYSLDRWDIDNRRISINYSEVNDYDPDVRKPIIKKINSGLYRAPNNINIETGTSFIPADYNLESEMDFPTL